MLSDVGEAFARRRRDLTITTFCCFEISSFVSPFLNISSKSVLFEQSSRTLSNSGKYINRGRIQRLTSLDPTQISVVILSLNPTTSVSPQTTTAYPQTPEQFVVDTSIGSKSGLSQAPPSPPHRFSLMARVSLGPSDALFSVGASTAHDESQSWQVVLCGSSPTIISVQRGGASDPFPPIEPILGFGWMDLIPNCGPVTLTWPMYESCREVQTSSNFQALYKFVDSSPLLSKSRSAPLIAFPSLLLKVYCSIKNGRRRRSILVTISLDETCFYKSWNLMDRVAWLSSDASLILKLIGLVFLSNHRWCDLDHAFALLCEHIPSINSSSIKLNHPATSLMGDASQHSRIIWKKSPQNQTPLVASSMEHFIESSYASFARAIYDHKLIGDFSKLVFNHEFLRVSKDFSTFANFLKWCILENSLNLYLYLSCNALISICMNLPPLSI